MTLNEARGCLRRLAANWPKAELPAEKQAQYLACIADLPADVGELVVTQALTTCKWLPEIAEFRAIAASLYQQATGRPAADEAWAEVLRMIRRVGHYGAPRWSHPAIARAMEAIGWRQLCLSEENQLPVWRSQFMRIYEAQGEREVAEVQMLPGVRAGLARLAASLGAWREALPAPSTMLPESTGDGTGDYGGDSDGQDGDSIL